MTIYEGKNRVSSANGWRTHPITGKRTFHYGKDVVGQTSKNSGWWCRGAWWCR